MWTIYTYWNNASVIQALNAVAMVMGAGDFLGLMQTVALVGLLSAAGVGLFKVSFKEPAQYILMLVFFNGLLFVPKVTVSVLDVRSGAVGTVANVPLGVAFITSTTSHIGKYLTDTFETAFGMGDELKFSKTGMAWGAKALRMMGETRPISPKSNEAFSVFTKACVVPEVTQSTAKYVAMTSSVDVLTLLQTGRGTPGGFLNPGRIANMPNRTSDGYTVMPCITSAVGGSAYDEVVLWIGAEIPGTRSQLARRLLPDAPAATASTLLTSYLPGVEGAILGTSRTVTDQLTQAMTVNLMNESAGSLGVALGDAGAVQMAVGTVTAEASTASAYRVMGMIGEEALPKFRNLIEIVLICVFPLVALVIIVGGEAGAGALKTYAMTAVWVQLWAPLYAIVNNMLVPMTSSRMQAVAGGAISQTMQNSGSIIASGLTEQAMAGALVMAVPMIAYALVKGGEVAMSSATSSLIGGASGNATQQGSAAGMGNFGMGNTAWGTHSSNSVSANKWDTNTGMSMNRATFSNGNMQTSWDMQSGTGALNASHSVNDLGAYSAQASSQIQDTLEQGYERSSGSANRAAQSFKDSATSAYQKFKKNEASSGNSTGVTKAGSVGDSSTTGQQASDAMSFLKEWAKKKGVSEGQAFAYAFGLKAGLPGGIGPEARAQSQTDAKLSADDSEMAKFAQGSDFKALTDRMQSSEVKTTGSKGATTGNTNSGGAAADLTKAKQFAQDWTTSNEEAQKYSSAAKASKATAGMSSENLSNKIVAKLGGPQGAEAALRRNDSNAIKAAISQVVEEEVKAAVGGRTGGAPALSGQAGTDAARLQSEVKSGTGQVQGVVQAGQTATDKDYNANQKKLEGVSKTASVDGKTSEAVIATAGSNVDAGGKKVSAKATNVGYDGNAVKNSVVEKGEKASKPGGLGEMANNGTEDAVDQIVDQVSKAVLEPLAGDLKKSMGYPPAPPPPPAPAPPYKSWK